MPAVKSPPPAVDKNKLKDERAAAALIDALAASVKANEIEATQPEWVVETIRAHESRGKFCEYLGSVPLTGSYSGKRIMSEGGLERDDYVMRALAQKELMPHVVWTRERHFYFAVRANAIPFDYRADVSKIQFGELSPADLVNYKCPIPRVIESGADIGALTIFAIAGVARARLVLPGEKWGTCLVESCGHKVCAENRVIAASICLKCPNEIGYGRIYFSGFGSKAEPRYIHEQCFPGDYDVMIARRAEFIERRKG